MNNFAGEIKMEFLLFFIIIFIIFLLVQIFGMPNLFEKKVSGFSFTPLKSKKVTSTRKRRH